MVAENVPLGTGEGLANNATSPSALTEGFSSCLLRAFAIVYQEMEAAIVKSFRETLEKCHKNRFPDILNE